jgi:hypothetical protein
MGAKLSMWQRLVIGAWGAALPSLVGGLREVVFGRQLCRVMVVGAVFLAWGCAEKRLGTFNRPVEENVPCSGDVECSAGDLCVFGECVDASEFDCRGGQKSRILLNPTTVQFGEVALGNTENTTLTITNDGQCNLEIMAVDLSDDANAGFSCSPCDLKTYPQILTPGASFDVEVEYSPLLIGEASGTLLVRSNAGNVPELTGLAEVALHANYGGVPALVVDPPELSFGYVPFNTGLGGSSETKSIKIMNQGSGNALLTVEFIYLRPGTDFGIADEWEDVSPSNPLYLPIYDANDPSTWLEIPVTFAPNTYADHTNILTIQAHLGDAQGSVEVNAHISGSSLGAPQILVEPSELEFKTSQNEPLNVGWSEYRSLTVKNIGQSDLVVELALDDPMGDYTFSPAFVPPLAAGTSIALSVLYTPSQASDAFNPSNPQSSADAWFRILSNDPDDVLTTVDLHGWAQSGLADDVLKVEMTFANNSSNWAQNDFRNVDLELVSPLGYSCKKPFMGQNSAGTLQIIDNYCDTWSNTGLEGTTTWISGGAFEEPERIIVYGLGAQQASGQEFVVNLHYVEDCANVPTGLVADLAGVGVSTLLGALSGSAGFPLTISPDTISGLIEANCWSHDSSLVNVTIYVNGNEVASTQRNLQAKGDVVEAIRILRQNGQFSVVNP